MEICQYILINMVSQNLPHRNSQYIDILINWYHKEICQYILINILSKNLPHGNLSIHINKYGIPEFLEICQYMLINMVSPHGNLSIHINKYGMNLPQKFVNTY